REPQMLTDHGVAADTARESATTVRLEVHGPAGFFENEVIGPLLTVPLQVGPTNSLISWTRHKLLTSPNCDPPGAELPACGRSTPSGYQLSSKRRPSPRNCR